MADDERESLSIVPADCWESLPNEFRRLLLVDALLVWPSPATRKPHCTDQSELKWRESDATVLGMADMDVAIAVSAIRWMEVMEELLIDAPGAASLLSDLIGRTRQGQQIPGVETLADMHPKIAELMCDGSPALLAMAPLRTAYAKLTCALCGICSSSIQLELPPSEYGFNVACLETCAERAHRVGKALVAMKRCEEAGDQAGLDLACGQVIALDPTLPEPFLARGGLRLRESRRREAHEYLKVYLVWSSQRGFHAENHAKAYWRLAECFLTELEQRNALQGALLEDRTFHSLVDSVEVSLSLAFRYDDDRTGLATSASARHVLQRLEVMRSARRTAAEFLDAPVVSHVGAEGQPHDSFCVPWPLDLTAGLSDLALFSRAPTTGSSQSHRPLELLFLGSRTVLDIMVTLSNIAARSTSFAHLNAECLHWKYRPKPVHVHFHTNDIARLAQALLCFMIMKQMGEQVAQKSFPDAANKRGRFLCSLLVSVLFCRALTVKQRAEVDRLLCLLVLAATDIGSMARAFPWLELDDDRKSTLPLAQKSKSTAPARNEPTASQEGFREYHGESIMNNLEEAESGTAGSQSGEEGFDELGNTSHLLFQLQQVWLGWLSVASGEESVSRPETPTRMPTEPVRHFTESYETRWRFRTESSEAFADFPRKLDGVSEDSYETLAAQRVDAEEVHRAARVHLLGQRAATTFAALHPTGRAMLQAQLSQRRIWALTGHFPAAGEFEGSTPPNQRDGVWAAEEMADDHVDPQLGENNFFVWRRFVEEIRLAQEWRLNPCVLDHVTWTYDPDALTDPFLIFSWQLYNKSAQGAAKDPGNWRSAPPGLEAVAFDAKCSETPVLFRVLDHIYQQLQRMGAIFHALEARDASWALDLKAALSAEDKPGEVRPPPKPPPSAAARRRNRVTYRTAADKVAPVSSYQHAHISDELRRRVAEEEEEERTIELTRTDIVGELEELRRRRRDLSLELELRDYITLASMKAKEADWWGEGARNASAYALRQAGSIATWSPALEECAPIRLRIFAYAGTPWNVLKAACFRGAAFDAIDASSSLCQGIGFLGLSSWFDTLLKPVPHSYIQTRHCEEFFLHRLEEHRRCEWSPQSVLAAAQTATVAKDCEGQVRPPPLDPAIPMARLATTGPFWPREQRPRKDKPIQPKAVLSANGLARRPGCQPVPPKTAEGSPTKTSANLALRLRPIPTVSPAGPKVVRQVPVNKQIPNAAAVPARKIPTYTAESELFEHFVRESFSSKATAAELQTLMGMAVRAEPLYGELGLAYLGAANLRPARGDFLPRDSVLTAAQVTDWPGDVSMYSEATLGGTKSVSVQESRSLESAGGDSLCVPDVAAFITKYSDPPDDEKKARALGPRILRLRKVGGGHPSLSPFESAAEERRCGNAAFCTRRVDGLSQSLSEEGKTCCPKCKCTWYCSKLCQANHFVAHHFECQSLRQLRAAAQRFEVDAALKTKLAELLEELLSQQLVASPPSATSLGASLRDALQGELSTHARQAVAKGQELMPALSVPKSTLRRGKTGFLELPCSLDANGGHPFRPPAASDFDRQIASQTKPGRKISVVLGSDTMVLLPEEQTKWKVPKCLEVFDPIKQVSEAEESNRRSRCLFETRSANVHTAVSVVRLMSRWAGLTGMQAVKEATENGLFFCLISGLSLTKHFASRLLPAESMVAVLSHRMSLHVAASQDWSLVPMMKPPPEFQEVGASGLEVAQYTAYYAFLTHRRLPFKNLRPLMPVVCFAWGARARDALLALPYLLEPAGSPSARPRPSNRVGTFADVVRDYLSDIQLVDSVKFDEATGRAWFLLYNSVMSNTKEGWVLLLDATRGLQAISSPLSVSELRRCAL